MNKDNNILKLLYKWNVWDKKDERAGIDRTILNEILKYLPDQKIIALKGIRRSGKSTLFFQIIQHLITTGTDPKRTLYINFEDPFFASETELPILDKIFNAYQENVNPHSKPFLFLDEIQNIDKWEKWVRAKNELGEAKIFVTGSSAKLLSSEIATVLTGRHLSFSVYPLSFKEFLTFKGFHFQNEKDVLTQENQIRHYLSEYLHYGGMPEIVLTKEEEKKEIILKQYFEDILFRDVVLRHEIRDVNTLRKLAVHYITNISNLNSYNKIKNTYGIPMDVVRNYTSYLTECYLLHELSKFSYKVGEQQIAPKKIYTTDLGIRNCVAFRFSEDLGRLAENAVFNTLQLSKGELYYAKDKNETDFLVKKGTKITKAIQVCFSDLEDPKLLEREIKGLKEASDNYGIKDLLLITDKREGEINQEGLVVPCLPLFKFLIQDTL